MTWNARPPIRSPFARAAAPEAVAIPDATDDDGPLRILTVCTGNICRSAYAHHVLQARLDELAGPGAVVVSSAGTGPNQALAVPQEILDLAPSEAVREALRAHRPRQLTARLLAGQDLVLAATDAHLDAVLREDPGAVRRTFTLLEAGTLAAGPGSDAGGAGRAPRLRGLTTAMAEARAARPYAPSDLPDPFRGPRSGYEAMAAALDPAVEAVARAVAGVVRGA